MAKVTEKLLVEQELSESCRLRLFEIEKPFMTLLKHYECSEKKKTKKEKKKKNLIRLLQHHKIASWRKNYWQTIDGNQPRAATTNWTKESN